MKRLIYILAIVSLVVAASGCTGDAWSSNKTYSGSGVTFVYPGTWSENSTLVSNPSGASNVVAVGTQNEAFAFGNINVTGLSDSLIQQVLTEVVNQYKAQNFTSVKSINVDGTTATMLTTSSADSSGLYSSIAFWGKNSKIHFAAYVSKTNDTQNFEKILGTLKTS
ncbi:MAG TPA: hypothetical protein VK444_04600 [Methanobacteriaceae archaeon]|nr:hypothetical protein [Methanobacteriaceae archaeon]